jgi:hypothetical protein
MGKFRHTPDNYIFIDDGVNPELIMPLSFFLTLDPTYTLPVGDTSRYYDDAVTDAHYTSTGSVSTLQIFPYTDGDTYIASVAAYTIAYNAYLNPAPSLSAAKESKIEDMIAYEIDIKNGYIIYLGHQFFSYSSILKELVAEDITYTRLAAIPTPYTINDVGYNAFTIAAIANSEAIIDTIVDLHYLCRINENVHRAGINACVTVVAVTAYDYTTGWPITPYSSYITFYAKYSTTIDATYAGGTDTGTATGGAAIASGILDLSHDDVRYVSYDGTSNVNNQQTGYIRFFVKPDYSGAPAADKVFITISKADIDAINLIEIRHLNATSNIRLIIKDQAAANVISSSLGAWTPVLGTWYEFELYYDLTSGNTFLMIDHVQLGATSAATGTRSASIDLLRIGASYDSTDGIVSNFDVKELIVTSQ